ncbi:helix-turn-helix domain-containing protein [Sphingobacterium sp. HMA12]|uniref:helix-turn-helix domain-containing protein n=1 Tax=Sphingobacterium sp. HMA12 TaxID=2050894 RepID=UPI0013152908|nr:helix-turn-helix transcriptional regulator [Sphingobacterium sp. HMA12]
MTKKDKNFDITIARWLAKLRVEKTVSQEYLAVQLGKGQSDIAKIESGSKKVTVIELLSWMAALDIPYERINEIFPSIYNDLST